MTQKRIKQLLEEASSPQTSKKRREAIVCTLTNRVANDLDPYWYGTSDHFSYGKALETLMDQLLYSTMKNRPDLFKSLFPVVALVCGNRKKEGGYAKSAFVRRINWSLV